MKHRLFTATTVALAMAAVLVAYPASATHPPDPYRPPLDGARVVHVGGGDLRNQLTTDLEVQLTAFYPETMKVRRGDTVEWRFAPGFATFHTVTFLPGDMDVAAAPESLESAHAHTVRADETPETLALSEELMLGYGCGLIFPDGANGRPPQEPCQIDSTAERYGSQLSDAFFNINRPQPQGFAATIDLPAGLYRYHCTFHPSMHGYIEVVDEAAELASQDEIDAAASAQIAADLETAKKLYAEKAQPQFELDGDRRIWTVHAGARSDDGRVAINDYIPAELELRPGDGIRVEAHGGEPHSATFPSEAVGTFSLQGCDMSTCEGDFAPVGLVLPAVPWACEYDDPAGGAPAVPTWVPTAGCTGGGQVEWQLGAHLADATPAPGGLVATETTFHNSGMMVDSAGGLPEWYTDRPGDREWPSTFVAEFPTPGTFTFTCLIHPGKVATEAVTGSVRQGMVGTIRVRSS